MAGFDKTNLVGWVCDLFMKLNKQIKNMATSTAQFFKLVEIQNTAVFVCAILQTRTKKSRARFVKITGFRQSQNPVQP